MTSLIGWCEQSFSTDIAQSHVCLGDTHTQSTVKTSLKIRVLFTPWIPIQTIPPSSSLPPPLPDPCHSQ